MSHLSKRRTPRPVNQDRLILETTEGVRKKFPRREQNTKLVRAGLLGAEHHGTIRGLIQVAFLCRDHVNMILAAARKGGTQSDRGHIGVGYEFHAVSQNRPDG